MVIPSWCRGHRLGGSKLANYWADAANLQSQDMYLAGSLLLLSVLTVIGTLIPTFSGLVRPGIRYQ